MASPLPEPPVTMPNAPRSAAVRAAARRAPPAGAFVGGGAPAVPQPADDDAERARVGGRAGGGAQAERRVVVLRVERVRPAVHRVVPVLRQPVQQMGLQFVTGVVGAE